MTRYCSVESRDGIIEQTSTDLCDIGVHDTVIVVRIQQHFSEAAEHRFDLHQLRPFRLDSVGQPQLLGPIFGVRYVFLEIRGCWLFVIVGWVTHCSVENTGICCGSCQTLSPDGCQDNVV